MVGTTSAAATGDTAGTDSVPTFNKGQGKGGKPRNTSNDHCYHNCGKFGHWALDCWRRPPTSKSQEESSFPEAAYSDTRTAAVYNAKWRTDQQ